MKSTDLAIPNTPEALVAYLIQIAKRGDIEEFNNVMLEVNNIKSKDDHAYRIAKVVARAEEVIGSQKEAIHWLRDKQAALGNCVPFELIGTSVGAEAVEDLLGRIEHGVYS